MARKCTCKLTHQQWPLFADIDYVGPIWIMEVQSMTETAPQVPIESNISNHPIAGLVALYQGALDATGQALHCLEVHDIFGRGKAINKVLAILSELLISLDNRPCEEFAQNLERLYLHIRNRLIEAHSTQTAEPLLEVQEILRTLHEGWREASAEVLPLK
jgi:flagellar secretion chaperone FliS